MRRFIALAMTICLSACDGTVAGIVKPTAKPAAVSGSPKPATSAAPLSGADNATGSSAAALADPYAVGRIWVYDTGNGQSPATCTIEITGKKGTELTLKITLRYDANVESSTRTVSMSGNEMSPYPFGMAIYNLFTAYTKPTGPNRTTTAETVTVPAGTFETTKVSYQEPSSRTTTAFSWVSDKYGVIKQEVHHMATDEKPVAVITLRSIQ